MREGQEMEDSESSIELVLCVPQRSWRREEIDEPSCHSIVNKTLQEPSHCEDEMKRRASILATDEMVVSIRRC
jgi:hypothetical protein